MNTLPHSSHWHVTVPSDSSVFGCSRIGDPGRETEGPKAFACSLRADAWLTTEESDKDGEHDDALADG